MKGTKDTDFLDPRQLWMAVRRHPWLVLGFTGIAAVIAVGSALVQPSLYRSTATLVLDTGFPAGGVLGELNTLVRTPYPVTEIALLESRPVAEGVAKSADGNIHRPSGDQVLPRHLGLTTLVEDSTRQTSSTITAGLYGGAAPEGRLFADVDADADESACFEVEFLGSSKVSIRYPIPWWAFYQDDGKEILEYQAGHPLRFGGYDIRLRAEGSVVDRPFLIQTIPFDSAVRRVMNSVDVKERERGSGVLLVTATDSDPERAADLANAVCLNYIDLRRQQEEWQASRTLDFIQSQLEEQTRELESAEEELVRLKETRPDSIDIQAVTHSLVEQLKELQLQEVRLGLQAEALVDALDLFDRGQVEAFSRLGKHLDDSIIDHYLREISSLSSSLSQVGRSDGGAYRAKLQERWIRTDEEHTRLELEIQALHGILERLKNGDRTVLSQIVGENAVSSTIRGDRLTLIAIEAIGALTLEQDRMRRQFTPRHPKMIEVQENLDDLHEWITHLLSKRLQGLETQAKALAQLTQQREDLLKEEPEQERLAIRGAIEELRQLTRQHLENRLRALGAEGVSIDREIRRMEKRLGELPESERLLASGVRRKEAHQEIVRFLLNSQQEAEIARASSVPLAHLIDPAQPATQRSSPRVRLILMAGVLLGLGIAVMGASLWERARGRVHTSRELEEVAGLPVFSEIGDFGSSVRDGQLYLPMLEDPSGAASEAYRSLRTEIQSGLGGPGMVRTLGVTSTYPGEGKTTTNICLAFAFARTGRKVLLVDANLRRPRLHDAFGEAQGPGFADAIAGHPNWPRLVIPNIDANLSILPAGDCFSSPGDLLSHQCVDQLVQEFLVSYEMVIFDLPHVDEIADVLSLCPQMDAVVYLTQRRSVSYSVLSSCLERLQSARVNLLGVVLNRTDLRYEQSPDTSSEVDIDAPVEPMEDIPPELAAVESLLAEQRQGAEQAPLSDDDLFASGADPFSDSFPDSASDLLGEAPPPAEDEEEEDPSWGL